MSEETVVNEDVSRETPEVKVEVPPAAPETEQKPSEQAPEEKPKGQQRFDRKIDRLYKRAAVAEAEAQVLREQLAKREVRIEDPKAPKPDDFSTYSDYLEKLADWKADQKVSERLSRYEEEQKLRQVQTEQEKILSSWDKHLNKAKTKYEDFDEVISEADWESIDSSNPRTGIALGEAIRESDIGTEIYYYLAKNPDELERIGALRPASALKEIGRLEDKLKSKTPEKKISSAPEPIKPVGQSATGEKDPKDMTDKEYAEWFRKRRAGKAKA